MNCRKMSKTELLEKFDRLVRSERKITALVLEFIAEIDVRKIHLEQAYPSLFDYLVQKYGYSRGAAARRIAAAKLLLEVPEVSAQIDTGALNLCQVAKLQNAIKSHQETTLEKVPLETKKELLGKIAGTTFEQTELILAQNLQVNLQTPTKQVIHRDESMTFTMTFNKEQLAWLQQARDLISHAVPDLKWENVFTHLCKKEVKRRRGVSTAA